MTLPRVQSVDREPIVYDVKEPTRVQTCDDDTSLFLAKPASRYAAWSRSKPVKKWSPVKQTMLFALMSSLSRTTVDW